MKDAQPIDGNFDYISEVNKRAAHSRNNSSLNRKIALQYYSTDMAFFKKNNTYKNTAAAFVYKEQWKENTGLNPISASLLFHMAKHARKIAATLTFLVAVAFGATLALGFVPLTLPLVITLIGAQITTGIGLCVGLRLLLGDDAVILKDVEKKAGLERCPTKL